MPTYLYKCPVHDEFEIEHSINESFERCPHCLKENKDNAVKKLICAENGFILNGSGWGRDNYS